MGSSSSPPGHTRARLLAGAARLAVPLASDQLDALEAYAEELLLWAPRFNLISIRDLDSFVDLLHQVTLADASYRGIAGHLADLVEVLGEQERLSPHPRRGESGLDAGMATTDDDDLRLFHVEHLVLDHFPMQNRSKIRSSTSSVVA